MFPYHCEVVLCRLDLKLVRTGNSPELAASLWWYRGPESTMVFFGYLLMERWHSASQRANVGAAVAVVCFVLLSVRLVIPITSLLKFLITQSPGNKMLCCA